MAVTTGPDGGPDEGPKLAVDSTRLARIASRHPAFGLGAAGWGDLTGRLRPAVRDPLVLRGRGVTVTATVEEVSVASIELWIQLRPVNGGFTANVKAGRAGAGAPDVLGRHAAVRGRVPDRRAVRQAAERLRLPVGRRSPCTTWRRPRPPRRCWTRPRWTDPTRRRAYGGASVRGATAAARRPTGWPSWPG